MRLLLCFVCFACLHEAFAQQYTYRVPSWSVYDIQQTLPPDITAEVEASVLTDRPLVNVQILSLSSSKDTFVLFPSQVPNLPQVVPSKWAQLPAGENKVILKITSNSSATKDPVETFVFLLGTDPTTGQLVQSGVVPVRVRTDLSVKNDFSELAADLLNPDTQATLVRIVSKFVPSLQQRALEIIGKLDLPARVRQANFFKGARLILGTDDYQIYKGPWIEADGRTSEVEFSLFKYTDGKWLIANW